MLKLQHDAAVARGEASGEWLLGRRILVKCRSAGLIVWRIEGRRGGDMSVPPAQRWVDQQTHAYLAENERFLKAVRLREQLRGHRQKGVKTRQNRADARAEQVLSLAEQHGQRLGRGLAAFIAKKVHLTPRRVRDILKIPQKKSGSD